MPLLAAPLNGSAVADHDQLLWLAPSVLWEDGSIGSGEVGFEQPRLVELTTDDFVDEFQAFMSGSDPGGEGPAGIGNHGPSDGDGSLDDPFVLYQPMHQRYYFVTGSLVCRRVGLPDRTVSPVGERLSFVVRRLATRTGTGGAETWVEQAWLPASSGWVDVSDPSALAPGEEQLPMHSAAVGAPVATGAAAALLGLDEPGRRSVQFGYVPVAGRTARPPTMSDSAALAALQAAGSGAGVGDDARIMAFRLRISAAWRDMVNRKKIVEDLPDATPFTFDRSKPQYVLFEPSLFVLLELYDWLDTYLPSVRDALIDGTTLSGTGNAAREALRAKLDINIYAGGAEKRLGTALGEVAQYMALLRGDESVGRPTTQYDVTHGTPPDDDPLDDFDVLYPYTEQLAGLSRDNGGVVGPALVEEDADASGEGAPAQVPAELSGMIVARPATADAAELDDRHVLRLVYEHEPCRPVLSKPSAVVRLAGVYDPDAPARKVRIQVPDPANMRRFNRGVAIEMPPNLRKILDGVTPKVLKEEPLGEGSEWGVGMICSFSFQIFMILSFIIAFIFLILLNIAFWWMAFIKICFPIPMKKSQGGP
jgi:hypothetical protein